jgi:hypothetical protein
VAATSAILIPQVEVADARNSPIYGLPKSSSEDLLGQLMMEPVRELSGHISTLQNITIKT